jgi:hypothetical protein
MKLHSLALAAAALVGLAKGAENPLEEHSVTDSPALEHIHVLIDFPENDKESDTTILINDEEHSVRFRVANSGPEQMVLAAYGGAIYHKNQDTPYLNLTTVKLGPYQIPPDSQYTAEHAVKMSVPPLDFDLAFTLYVQYGSEILQYTHHKMPITIRDPPISSLDPRLVIVQLVLGVSTLAAGYFLTQKVIIPYLDTKFPKDKKAAAAVPVVSEPSAKATTEGKSYDEEWIPQHHLRPRSQNRKRSPAAN